MHHEAEAILAASHALDTATAPRDELVRTITALQRATGLALDAHAALQPAPDAAAPAHPSASPDAPQGDASGDDLLERARRIDAEHRAAHGRGASLRRLQTALGIGQKRAQRLQRALAGGA